MKIDLDDVDDWAKFGKRGPDRVGRPPHFQHSKLFTAKRAVRGNGFTAAAANGSPKFVFVMGYTTREGIGADSRMVHRNRLRSQANYHGLDGVLGPAESFDKDGPVDRVWSRVEEWENDKRYFRASLNPLNHDEVKDWHQFGREFMETMQHGSQRTFDPDANGMHWYSDGLLTDDDRAAGKTIDWVMSMHHETGRTHMHLLFRGTLGNDDLYIMPQATKQLWVMGQGVLSMDHHVGMKLENSPELDRQMEKTIKHDIKQDDIGFRKRLNLDMDID